MTIPHIILLVEHVLRFRVQSLDSYYPPDQMDIPFQRVDIYFMVLGLWMSYKGEINELEEPRENTVWLE